MSKLLLNSTSKQCRVQRCQTSEDAKRCSVMWFKAIGGVEIVFNPNETSQCSRGDTWEKLLLCGSHCFNSVYAQPWDTFFFFLASDGLGVISSSSCDLSVYEHYCKHRPLSGLPAETGPNRVKRSTQSPDCPNEKVPTEWGGVATSARTAQPSTRCCGARGPGSGAAGGSPGGPRTGLLSGTNCASVSTPSEPRLAPEES